VFERLPLVTASQSGLPQSDRVISALQRCQLLKHRISRPARPVTSARRGGIPPYFPLEGFHPFEVERRAAQQSWLMGYKDA
jgi:hypothetical protein